MSISSKRRTDDLRLAPSGPPGPRVGPPVWAARMGPKVPSAPGGPYGTTVVPMGPLWYPYGGTLVHLEPGTRRASVRMTYGISHRRVVPMVPRQSVRVTSHRRVVPMVPRAMIPTPPASARRDPVEGSSSTRGPLPLPYFGLLSARQASHRPPGPRVRPYGRTGSEGSAWYRGGTTAS